MKTTRVRNLTRNTNSFLDSELKAATWMRSTPRFEKKDDNMMKHKKSVNNEKLTELKEKNNGMVKKINNKNAIKIIGRQATLSWEEAGADCDNC